MSRMDQALCLVLTLSSKQPRKSGLIPILFMRTWRHQEPTVLVEVHTAYQWKSQIVNTDVLDTKAPKKPLRCITQCANWTPLTTLLGVDILNSLFHLHWEGENSRAGLPLAEYKLVVMLRKVCLDSDISAWNFACRKGTVDSLPGFYDKTRNYCYRWDVDRLNWCMEVVKTAWEIWIWEDSFKRLKWQVSLMMRCEQ